MSTDLCKKNKFPLKLLKLAKIEIQPCCTVCVDTRMGLFQNGQKNVLIMQPYPVPHSHQPMTRKFSLVFNQSHFKDG